ncbi:hypothetical protein C8R47DRAFT_1074341 [Mycena vitilis]|nr:hypothetical protein C8R47DRAFT_1074341 [Mycena vitilis]
MWLLFEENGAVQNLNRRVTAASLPRRRRGNPDAAKWFGPKGSMAGGPQQMTKGGTFDAGIPVRFGVDPCWGIEFRSFFHPRTEKRGVPANMIVQNFVSVPLGRVPEARYSTGSPVVRVEPSVEKAGSWQMQCMKNTFLLKSRAVETLIGRLDGGRTAPATNGLIEDATTFDAEIPVRFGVEPGEMLRWRNQRMGFGMGSILSFHAVNVLHSARWRWTAPATIEEATRKLCAGIANGNRAVMYSNSATVEHELELEISKDTHRGFHIA